MGIFAICAAAIEARSPGPGRGSEFVVRLPRAVSPEAREAPVLQPAPEETVRRRVLIADDNRDGAESLAILLRVEGHDVSVVHDGAAALVALERLQPQVALLDIGMPGLTGYEVARRVRQSGFGRSMLLVAITGWGQDTDKVRAVEAGFDHHFTKPIEPDWITALLRTPDAAQ